MGMYPDSEKAAETSNREVHRCNGETGVVGDMAPMFTG